MSDDRLAQFDALAFPGGRAPVNRPDPKPKQSSDSEAWDNNPVTYLVNGEEQEFFTIGHLARALNRKQVTIRAWENRGALPRSPFRSPAPNATPNFGTVPKGRRLYTREMIEGILQIAKECRVITDPHQKPPSEEFTLRVSKLFLAIRNASSTTDN
jgi:DNA-binding transcriptional MerR regulator